MNTHSAQFATKTRVSKQAFIRPDSVERLIQQERSDRNWIPHSLAVVLISPRADQIVLVIPAKLEGTDGQYQLSLPQRRLRQGDSVWEVADSVTQDVSSVKLNRDNSMYLGSARGNKYNGATCTPYGKWVHWIGMSLGGKHYNRRLNFRSEVFKEASWCSHNQLTAMQSAFSDRKYWMLLNALQGLKRGSLAHSAAIELQR